MKKQRYVCPFFWWAYLAAVRSWNGCLEQRGHRSVATRMLWIAVVAVERFLPDGELTTDLPVRVAEPW